MNAKANTAGATPALIKPDPSLPALYAKGHDTLAIRAGVNFAGHLFAEETAVPMPADLVPGTDYAVAMPTVGSPIVVVLPALPLAADVLGGFHFAPGGNANARKGGDDVPAINPFSIWDVAFRPACPDPRGMTLVRIPNRLPGLAPFAFWCDIYLTGVDHKTKGTSAFGQTIADGDDVPDGLERFDYPSAMAVMAEHGKQLLSFEEFAAAAYGVTEKTACGKDPKKTKLDAPRTSRWGVQQATGSMWTWGHDGDPDEPRASLFGGSWFSGGDAGSRCAYVDVWPGSSLDVLGARGRSDHLQPA